MDLTLGKRIANLRRQKELRQEDLAEQLNVSAQAVSKWENDLTCPDITLLPQLASILGVTVDVLLTGQAEEPTSQVKLLPSEERKSLNERMLRILLDSRDGNTVRINLPLALVQVAVDMGMELHAISGGNEALKKIDLKQIWALIEQGVIGNLVEVEDSDGDTIRIFVE